MVGFAPSVLRPITRSWWRRAGAGDSNDISGRLQRGAPVKPSAIPISLFDSISAHTSVRPSLARVASAIVPDRSVKTVSTYPFRDGPLDA